MPVRPNGIRFTAAPATVEFTKRWQPQPGDIVSFKHHGFMLSSKKPKLATLHRLRTDLSWEDVVNNWKEQKPATSGMKEPCETQYLTLPSGICAKEEDQEEEPEGALEQH